MLERPPGRRQSPLTVMIVAVLLAVGELLALVHLTTTRHEICAEHGELVHGHDSAHEMGDASPDAPPDEKSPAHDSDEHCRSCSDLSAASLPTPMPAVVMPLPVACKPERLLRAHAHVRREVYGFAPKTSPPTA